MTDPTPPLVDPAPKTPVSPKVIAAAILAFVAPALIAVLTYVQNEGVDVIGIHNPILGTLVSALIVSALAALAGYLTRDALREKGARQVGGVVPNAPQQPGDFYQPQRAELDEDGNPITY